MNILRNWLHFTGLQWSLVCVVRMDRGKPMVQDYWALLKKYRYVTCTTDCYLHSVKLDAIIYKV